jgi:hypothetical protein
MRPSDPDRGLFERLTVRDNGQESDAVRDARPECVPYVRRRVAEALRDYSQKLDAELREVLVN